MPFWRAVSASTRLSNSIKQNHPWATPRLTICVNDFFRICINLNFPNARCTFTIPSHLLYPIPHKEGFESKVKILSFPGQELKVDSPPPEKKSHKTTWSRCTQHTYASVWGGAQQFCCDRTRVGKYAGKSAIIYLSSLYGFKKKKKDVNDKYRLVSTTHTHINTHAHTHTHTNPN